ncbi:MAG: GNAT family N-acetyltransferase [Actinomycetota bacterium]|nr:GNAT family N-acetyltransferase [Actinomycetota bacterium]
MTSNGERPPAYPAHREADVVLRDGSTMRIRPTVAADAAGVTRLLEGVSDESLRLRFHGMRHPKETEIESFVEVDYRDRFGLVAEATADGRQSIAALANYVKTAHEKAEIAVIVDDHLHGSGLGSLLIEHLSEAAAEAGISTFVAEVLTSNASMLEVIRSMEVPVESRASDGLLHLEFPTSPSPRSIQAFERREAVAAAAGIRHFFVPQSIAVIGASRRRGTVGGEIFRNLLDAEFAGPVYPVNPRSTVIQSVPAYQSVGDVPGDVDLAVIVVPAALVIDTAEQCGRRGVRALLVISAGFSEVGEEGAERQRELVAVARRYGMRIIGPNCMGVLNTHPDVRMNATFASLMPPAGRLAFSSQSGALGIAVMDRARALGLGLSSFASVGNKADISGNDLIQYWEQDDETDVILLYLESFGNPRKFARIARRISMKKPIVAVKSGRSEAGARAAASHTGSMVAGDIAVDALFRQAGVIRTDTLEELFDVASLLAYQPLPRGKRVAILTNAGGLGILCADACEAAGLEVHELSDNTRAELASFLAAEASVHNPVDMIASASAEQYGRALKVLIDADGVDSVIVIFIPPLLTRAEDVADALVGAAASSETTVMACFLGVQGVHERLSKGQCVIPSHAFPESAAHALGRVTHYASWRFGDKGQVPELFEEGHSARLALAADLLAGGPRWLEPDGVARLLHCYGIPSVASRTVTEIDEVEAAAAAIDKPVVLKIVSSTVLHKTDVGGVRVGLNSPVEAATAAREMSEALRERGLLEQVEGWLVQEMETREGKEMFVGMTLDPSFGPLLACGVGGTMVELIRDVSVRITPLTDLDAREMLTSLKAWPLFEGYRGQPPLDASALQDLLLRLSTMVEELPHLAEIDLNPVLVFAEDEGCVVLDARVRIEEPQKVAPRGARSRASR